MRKSIRTSLFLTFVVTLSAIVATAQTDSEKALTHSRPCRVRGKGRLQRAPTTCLYESTSKSRAEAPPS